MAVNHVNFCTNTGLTLGHCLRRDPNLKPALGQRLVFSGMTVIMLPAPRGFPSYTHISGVLGWGGPRFIDKLRQEPGRIMEVKPNNAGICAQSIDHVTSLLVIARGAYIYCITWLVCLWGPDNPHWAADRFMRVLDLHTVWILSYTIRTAICHINIWREQLFKCVWNTRLGKFILKQVCEYENCVKNILQKVLRKTLWTKWNRGSFQKVMCKHSGVGNLIRQASFSNNINGNYHFDI